MAEDRELHAGLRRLADAVSPATAADALAGAGRSRARRHRRRRQITTGVGLVSVLALVGAALVISRAGGDDGRDAAAGVDEPASVDLPRLPNEIVAMAGDDQALWVLTARARGRAAPSNSVLVRVGLDGQVTATRHLDGAVDQIAVSDDGVWVTGGRAVGVIRLDRDTLAVTATIPLRLSEPWCNRCPPGVDPKAFGANALTIAGGKPWVRGFLAEVVRIDPDTNEVDARLHGRGTSSGMAGTDDELWLAENGGLLRVDPNTAEVIGRLELVPTPNAPLEVARIGRITAAGGLLWADAVGLWSGPENVTVVVDPDTGDVLDVLDHGANAVGADAWFVQDGTLRRGWPAEDGPTFGPVPPDRPAAAAGGDYWWASRAREVTRVPAGGAPPSSTTVVRDPRDEIGPTDADGCTTPPPGAGNGVRVATPAGTPEGFVSRQVRDYPGGELIPVVDGDGCLIGWFAPGPAGFVSREDAEATGYEAPIEGPGGVSQPVP